LVKGAIVQNSTADLSNLFGSALNTLRNNRQQINDLDAYNRNHGDNMVHNLDVITQALRSEASHSPAAALGTAAQRLQTQGRGSTSQYYATGLNRAASQLRGKSALSNGDVSKLTHTVLGSVPARGGYAAQTTPAQFAPSVLDSLLGLATGAAAGRVQAGAGNTDGFGLDDLMMAGARYLQAKQAGNDNMTAIAQAAAGALAGSQPQQNYSYSPQSAAGGLIAQSVLGALLNR
jgi:hypothetical protein